MRQFLAGLVLISGAVSPASPLLAHHSFAAEFDIESPVQLRGTVVEVEFMNPHSWIHIDVPRDDGSMERWEIEGLFYSGGGRGIYTARG